MNPSLGLLSDLSSPLARSVHQRNTLSTPTSTASNGSHSNKASLLLKCTAGDTTVDYDINVTPLYEAIGKSDWKGATSLAELRPGEASTWVVRYKRDPNGNRVTGPNGILWRFLPVHSACALNPPATFLRTLLQSYPNGARTLDDQGLLPLHYACGASCSREVLYVLLMSFPQAALKEDPNGMLPLHYLAQWGPSEGGVLDMVMVATGQKVSVMDGDGNTPESLARNAEYAGSGEVAKKIAEFVARRGEGKPSSRGLSVVVTTPRSSHLSGDKYSSFEDDDMNATVIATNSNDEVETTLSNILSPSQGMSSKQFAVVGKGSENWNHQQMKQRSTRSIMNALGVSPVHKFASNAKPRKDRYHSWDGVDDGDPGLNPYDGELRRRNSFSFEQTNLNDSGHPISTAPSTSGSTWTTKLDGASHYGQSNVVHSGKIINGASTRRSNRTTRGFGAGEVNSQEHTNSSYSGSRHSQQRQVGSGLPPKSPRMSSTSGSRVQHMNQTSTSSSSGKSQSIMEQDARLNELREELAESSSRSTYSSHSSYGTQLTNHLQAMANAERKGEELRGEVNHRESSSTSERGASNVSVSNSHASDADEELLRLQQQKALSENVLLEEIQRLKSEKSHAEMELHKMKNGLCLDPIMSVSNEDQESDEDNDDVSKLTFDQHLEEGKGAHEGRKSNRIDQLVREKAMIDEAIQHAEQERKALARMSEKSGSAKSGMVNAEDVVSMAVEMAAEQAVLQEAEKYAELCNKFEENSANLKDTKAQLDTTRKLLAAEQIKSKEMSAKVDFLESTMDSSTKVHGEAVFTHLQEVKSLRASLDKATTEIAKHKTLKEELAEKDAKLGSQAAEVKDLTVKVAELKSQLAAAEESEASLQFKFDEQSSQLNEIRDSLRLVHSNLSDADEAQKKLRDDMKDRELNWEEERGALESEIRQLKAASSSHAEHDECSTIRSLDSKQPYPMNASPSMSETTLRMQLENFKREADEMRKYNTAIRKEHGETITDLECELEKERSSKTELLSQIVTLQYRIATLEQELDDEKRNSNRARDDVMSKVEDELYELKDQLRLKLEDAERSRRALDDMRGSMEEADRVLKSKLENAEERVRELTAELNEDTAAAEILELKREVNKLKDSDDGNSQKLWEAKKLRERELQDKEDEFATKLREMKKEHERALIDKEDSYLEQLREYKKKAEQSLREKEEEHTKHLRDARKREQSHVEKEEELQRKLNDAKNPIESVLREKDDELERALRMKTDDCESQLAEKERRHSDELSRLNEEISSLKKEVSSLQDEIAQLQNERREFTEDKIIVSELETQLREVKRDLSRQKKKHASEMNKMENKFELQKSKEGRLENQCLSMKSQIDKMVDDYEARLQDALEGQLQDDFYDPV